MVVSRIGSVQRGVSRQKWVCLTPLLNLSSVLVRSSVGILFWRQKWRPFPKRAFVPVEIGSVVSNFWHVRFLGIESYSPLDMQEK